MIDIHIHILPGVDDGPATFEQALEICRLAAADGCHTLIATPHQRHDRWENRDRQRLRRLLERLQRALGSTIALELGAEIKVDSELLPELDELEASGLQPLCGGRHLLIELERHGVSVDPAALAHELRILGWQPILAHPELIPWLTDDERVAEVVAAGAELQLTAASLLGRHGRRVQRRCETWIEDGFVSYIASDAHHPEVRPPGLSAARRRVAELAGDDVAEALTRTNALRVLPEQPVLLHGLG